MVAGSIDVTEIERIEQNVSGEKPTGAVVTMSFSSSSPKETLGKIISVLIVVLKALRKDDWPEDIWWKENLPEWFTASFDHSLEEIMRDDSLWDFGSWIDAIKFRGWEWWSSEASDKTLKIYIQAQDDPYVIEAFEYAVSVSGGNNIVIAES